MNAPAKFTVDRDLPRPGWEPRERRFYDPVDLVLVFETPDGIGRTKHAGVYQTISDAQEAAGVTVWAQDGKGRLLSDCGKWRIQPVNT